MNTFENMKTKTENSDPSAPKADSLTDIIGYRAFDPAAPKPESKDGKGDVITGFEPKVVTVEFWEILHALHNDETVLLDREATDDVISRIDDLDPSDCWSLDQSECEDGGVELSLLSPDEIVSDMLLREPMATEEEISDYIQNAAREEMKTKAKGPSASEGESFGDVIGYRTLNPEGEELGMITSFEPEIECLEFREILEELHRGRAILFDRETADDVRERIEDLDPTDSWMLSDWECDDDKVELHLIPDRAILLRLSIDPSFTEEELRLAVEYRSWEG